MSRKRADRGRYSSSRDEACRARASGRTAPAGRGRSRRRRGPRALPARRAVIVGMSRLLAPRRSAARPVRPVRRPADHAFDPVRDGAGVGGEEAGVEAARPARRRDGAGDEMHAARGRAARWPRRSLSRARPAPPARRRALPSSRPVSSKVSRTAASASARALAALGRCTLRISCASACGSSVARDRHLPVARLDAAAGKHELAGHEFSAARGACPAAPSARRRSGRRRISVAASRGCRFGWLWSRSTLVSRSARSVIGASADRASVSPVALFAPRSDALRPRPSDGRRCAPS